MATPAFDLDAFLALPRLTNLHLSPDGSRLAVTVHTVAADGQSFVGAVWELATSGDHPPRRLTWSAKGETARGFLPDGSLLFTSTRPAPDGDDAAGHDGDALYVLPSAGGEPRTVLAPGDGVGMVVTARASSLVVVSTGLFPGSRGLDEDRARHKARADAGVTARLVEHYPDRYWDHDLGPREPHLIALDLADPGGDLPPPRDLTPDPPWAGWFEDVHFALSDDGSRVAFGAITHPAPRFKINLATAATSGEPGFRVMVDAEVDHGAMAWSPDGATLAVASTDVGAPDAPPHFHLCLLDAATGAVREIAPEWQAQAMEIGWTRDGRALLVTADDHGHVPLFRVDLDGAVTRLTGSGAYSNVTLSPDGTTIYAIRSHINEPPVPVALDVARANQQPRVLSSPVTPGPVGTRLDELTVTAADGAPVHSWLVLPEESAAGALPLAVMIHGGPVAAWGGWHWRWSASLLAARGWAVLLPNPRLSTGYGYSHFASAWSDWATLPAGDILASVDAAVARPDVDADRTAAMGGSYGGYMANWLAGGTDRFRAIVTHASVWNLTMQRDICDVGFAMDYEFGSPLHDEETWRRQSPHLRADALSSPMLVIHGLRDQRVPIGNAHSLWMELQLRGIPSRLLLFPDENHWILKPQNARVWYETVFGFLDEHVLGKGWSRPPLL